MKSALVEYSCESDSAILIPIEYLSADGIDKKFSQALTAKHRLSADAVELFNQAYSRYWERAELIFRQAPGFWFPARAQHILIARDNHSVPPYFQPFNKNSWVIYLADLDSRTSSVEFACYQFLHLERTWLIQQVEPVMVANLSYFLTLTDSQIDDFNQGCRKTTRPDAAAFKHLSDNMPAVRSMFHIQLRKPNATNAGSRVMKSTGLIVTDSTLQMLQSLQQSNSTTAVAASAGFKKHFAKPVGNSIRQLTGWLADDRPNLLITGEQNSILWDPDNPKQLQALNNRLESATQTAVTGMLNDLQTINSHTQLFLQSLIAPAELAKPAPFITPGGLCHLHQHRRLICYDIGPGRNSGRLWQPDRPYERLMLAARTVHEWGHLTAESGWVIIPEQRKALRDQLEQQLIELFNNIHSNSPAAIRARLAPEVTRLQSEHGSLGKGLLKRMLVRIEDFMANLAASRFLHPDAMDTYVRNNVHTHIQDYRTEGLYMQLTRLAYEFQYLRLSRIEDPLNWFYSSTWFTEYYINNGIIDTECFEQLTDVIGNICGCYQLDQSKFDFTSLGDRDYARFKPVGR